MSNRDLFFFVCLFSLNFIRNALPFKFLFFFFLLMLFSGRIYIFPEFFIFMDSYKSVYRIVCRYSYIKISIFRACISLVCTSSCHKKLLSQELSGVSVYLQRVLGVQEKVLSTHATSCYPPAFLLPCWGCQGATPFH